MRTINRYFQIVSFIRLNILLGIMQVLLSTGCQHIPGKSNSDSNEIRRNGQLFYLSSIMGSKSAYNWDLPASFPTPRVPSENPMSNEKVTLGRFLFYDKNLSQNQTQSCASCHLQEFAFTDRKTFGVGSTGEIHPRNAQNLANVAYNTRLTWSNNKMTSLEVQARGPMFGTSPIELGLTNDTYLDRLKSDSRYRTLFSNAFGGGTESITEQNIRFALSSFQRILISGKSKVDKYLNYGDKSALSASEIRGISVFNGETAECFHCHGGFNYTNTVNHTGIVFEEVSYMSNGIISDATYASLPSNKKGLYDVTLLTTDIGRFKAPSLRNIALTYPYMHDGSITCTTASPNDTDACSTEALGKVIDHYASGGQSHQNKDAQIRAFSLTPQERTDLINFLKALTDDDFISNSKFSDPFK
jgi:cytochrome c peroxidase